jgi:hypothetical protein
MATGHRTLPRPLLHPDEKTGLSIRESESLLRAPGGGAGRAARPIPSPERMQGTRLSCARGALQAVLGARAGIPEGARPSMRPRGGPARLAYSAPPSRTGAGEPEQDAASSHFEPTQPGEAARATARATRASRLRTRRAYKPARPCATRGASVPRATTQRPAVARRYCVIAC